jgi:hypothetical protein
VAARNLLLAERSRKPETGGIHGGERGSFFLVLGRWSAKDVGKLLGEGVAQEKGAEENLKMRHSSEVGYRKRVSGRVLISGCRSFRVS